MKKHSIKIIILAISALILVNSPISAKTRKGKVALSFYIYKVKRGDTLTKISKRASVPVVDILKLNRLDYHDRLYVGKRIKVPNKKRRYNKKKVYRKKAKKRRSVKRYRVRRGDTLFSIARKFDTTPKAICRANSIRINKSLRVNMRLSIPKYKRNVRTRATSGRTRWRRKGKLKFSWPIRHVLKCKRDSQSGIRAIGVIIKARPGSKIISSAKGTVKKIGYMRGFGNYIIVQHKNRYLTVYSNLKRITVRKGSRVRRGGTLGFLSRKKREFHFQIDRAGKALNPLRVLPKL